MPPLVTELVRAAEAFARAVYDSPPPGPEPRVTDRGVELADAIAAVRDAYDTPPFNPANILDGKDGRWYWNGIDVTDRPLGWRCSNGHRYEETLGNRLADAKCPECGT